MSDLVGSSLYSTSQYMQATDDDGTNENPSHDDGLLPLSEPSLLASQPSFRLSRRRREVESRHNPDSESHESLDQEEVSNGEISVVRGRTKEETHCHPAHPLIPRIWRIPDATSDPMMVVVVSVTLRAVVSLGLGSDGIEGTHQKNESRIVNSAVV
jgi:hypothetical protein